jgi:nitroreductase
MTSVNHRIADYPIDPLFLRRWSPRAFSGEPIAEVDLLTMLEAARWAASCYNSQPWRFVFARRDTPSWDRFLDLLVLNNRTWAKEASALVFLMSNSLMRMPSADKLVPSPTHSLDAGAASGYLALQACKLGWLTHGVAGFDRERAIAELGVPTNYKIEAAYAVGRVGDPSKLPAALQIREHPSGRLPLAELAFEGSFGTCCTG